MQQFHPFNKLKDCRYGKMLFNENDLYIGRSFDLYGEFSELEVEPFKQFVKLGNVVVDIGANIGAHTLLLAQLVGPSGRVLAFEPQRIVFQTLCANMALNSVTNTQCFQYALGEETGETKIPLLDYTKQANFGGLDIEQFKQGESTPLMTLDSFNLQQCNFIKIDVEGMEEKVLKGASKTIQQFRPFMLVENDRKEKSESLIQFLKSLNYRLYWFRPPMFNPNNFFNNPENAFGNIVSINMLCIPEVFKVVIEGLEEV
ncbi:MAG: FkbM family methyltransferase [Candidatus Caenarcaniphilales bacterium]|nr:FkbM family methyltransferase [Candidatus Caenarcaniphilales bacterium]